MTNQQAKTLEYGSKVSFLGTPAIVQCVRRNGVVISYDGKGLQSGQYVTKRVSATHLEVRQ